MLRNLLSNAIRYTEKGRVVLGCRRRGGDVAIEVHDTGVGIADSDRDAVFQAFTQLRTSADRSRQGLGLGLAIVDGMAQLLGHGIRVRSRPGVGTCFAVVVPCVGFAREAATAPRSPMHAALAGRRVWVIDDDSRVRAAMRQLLETWGLRVRVYASAAAATADAMDDSSAPELLLADLSLETPRAGLSAIAEIRRRIRRDVPAVIVSGEMTPEALEEIARSDLPYLRKPVAGVRLRMLLEHVLGSREPGLQPDRSDGMMAPGLTRVTE
jgi:CheY-like chemotaxis protein